MLPETSSGEWSRGSVRGICCLKRAKDFDWGDQMEDDMGIPLGTSDIMKLEEHGQAGALEYRPRG